MSRTVCVAAALVAAGVWSAPVHAQSPEALAGMMMVGDGPVLIIPVLLRFSELTPEQTDQVARILEAGRPEVQGLLGQLAEANTQLADALLAPKGVHSGNANAIVKHLAQLRLQFMQRQLNMVVAIRRLFTPQQLVKVNEAVAEGQKILASQLGRPLAGGF